MQQCLSKADVPQLNMVTWENCRIDDYLCSYFTSVTMESCTSRGPWLLLEIELSQLASLALSHKHLPEKSQYDQPSKRKFNSKISPSDPRDNIPYYKMETKGGKENYVTSNMLVRTSST